ncbi:sodium:solute symporter family transporter [Bacillus halotolerans]|uniref:sodium:solute symporter family transporter n=1 Tax=Bacillus halotolerans TaxID=260554 RepID=UPI003D2204A3
MLPLYTLEIVDLIVDLLPASLNGIFAAILFRVILSSFSGAVNNTVTLFTLNIYKPMFKPDDGEGEIVKSGRIFVQALGIVSMSSHHLFYTRHRAIQLSSRGG